MLVSTNHSHEKECIHVLEIMGNAIVGGMENYVRNLIGRLPVDQFRVTCLCPYESAMTAELRRMGCEVFVTFMDNEGPQWRTIQTTVEIIHNQRIDLIHAHLPKAHALAGLAGSLTRIPVVATIHGMNLTMEELGMSRAMGTHLIVVCQAGRHHALALGIPPERVTFIPNGVDLATFTPDRRNDAFRAALNVPLDAPLVGFIGRLAWEKGPDQFVRAAKRVHGLRPDVHFALVGKGPMESEVVSLIDDMDLADFIHLAGLQTDTWNVYPAFDVLGQTSRVEGMPLAVLEAMACGRPVVAMGTGGVLELIEVGSTGMLAAPGDWEGVGNALVDLLAQPAQVKAMGQAARQRVERLFDLEMSVRLTSELFSRLVQGRLEQPNLEQPNIKQPKPGGRKRALRPTAVGPTDVVAGERPPPPTPAWRTTEAVKNGRDE